MGVLLVAAPSVKKFQSDTQDVQSHSRQMAAAKPEAAAYDWSHLFRGHDPSGMRESNRSEEHHLAIAIKGKRKLKLAQRLDHLDRGTL